MGTTNEIRCVIKLSNGERLAKYFDDVEAAWLWERETRAYHKNRRAKADRLLVEYAFYCGCTSRGNCYGGILSGYRPSAVDMAYEQSLEFTRAKRNPEYLGPFEKPASVFEWDENGKLKN